ncbi:MAG: 50S ribosomal protein L15 [SAR86 cluster bacterium]|jgi:large subunit ribosomal protein L15|uniref:Large ribosomal subunit protein uL15 n=1 Tax=SAR86 cluster bacterium TaxID=2030880 RepID=A0A520N676_9GAMM|nr:MAG: 50S ribosomal protein L15 [SAR86 cluster bacterium]|tara:strand:- start:3803 stop:4291 length:489 start_codon:yes stop_codon:yes gene_type:complete
MSEELNNTMNLNSISDQGSLKKRKRVGRGIGSGLGKTAGRGHKGQKSRSGGSIRPGFEGGQMPLQMRLPKFGFSSRVNNNFKEVNIKNINGMDVINLKTLKENKIISKAVKKVKIFGNSAIESKVTVEGLAVSKGAKEAIEKAGGKIIDTDIKKDTLEGDKE